MQQRKVGAIKSFVLLQTIEEVRAHYRLRARFSSAAPIIPELFRLFAVPIIPKIIPE
jgi:hypothetical protein